MRDDLTANEFGGIRVVFSTDPSGDEHRLPDGLRPVTSIRSVELRDSEDRIILRNEFAPVTEFAPTGEFFQKEVRIESTASFNAFGAARVEATSDLVRVTIEVERLAAGGYELFADGRRLGVFAAEQGFLKAVLTSDGSEGVRIPPEARPAVNIRRIEVVGSGRVIASGEFAITSGAIGR